MIYFANVDISINAYFHRFFIVCNTQIVARMLKI